MNGLEKITDRILGEAQAEADRILAEAKAERERILAEYAARAEAIRTRLSEEAEAEGHALIAREKAAAGAKERELLLSVKSRLIDEAFRDAEAAVRGAGDDRYTEILVGLLTAAMLEQTEAERVSRTLYGEEDMVLPERYEVLFNRRDLERYGKVVCEGARKRLSGKVAPEVLEKLTLSANTATIGGGLILRCGSVETNCSLELIFAHLRDELESEVEHALFEPPVRR